MAIASRKGLEYSKYSKYFFILKPPHSKQVLAWEHFVREILFRATAVRTRMAGSIPRRILPPVFQQVPTHCWVNLLRAFRNANERTSTSGPPAHKTYALTIMSTALRNIHRILYLPIKKTPISPVPQSNKIIREPGKASSTNCFHWKRHSEDKPEEITIR